MVPPVPTLRHFLDQRSHVGADATDEEVVRLWVNRALAEGYNPADHYHTAEWRKYVLTRVDRSGYVELRPGVFGPPPRG